MQVLDMSGLASITTNDNGERVVEGIFDGVYVRQTLPAESGNGFYGFDTVSKSFAFVPVPENIKFSAV